MGSRGPVFCFWLPGSGRDDPGEIGSSLSQLNPCVFRGGNRVQSRKGALSGVHGRAGGMEASQWDVSLRLYDPRKVGELALQLLGRGCGQLRLPWACVSGLGLTVGIWDLRENSGQR